MRHQSYSYSVLIGFGLACLALMAVAKITASDQVEAPRPAGMRQALELLTKKTSMPAAALTARSL